MIDLLGKRPFPERNDAFDKYLNDYETEKIRKEEEKNEKRNERKPSTN